MLLVKITLLFRSRSFQIELVLLSQRYLSNYIEIFLKPKMPSPNYFIAFAFDHFQSSRLSKSKEEM
jgi:hypothetical protein